MDKLRFLFSALLFFFLASFTASAKNLAHPNIHYKKNIITITNQSSNTLNLNNSVLQFRAKSTISRVTGYSGFNLIPHLKFKTFGKLPHQSGNLYTIEFKHPTPSRLAKGQSIQLVVNSDQNYPLTHFKFFAETLTPIPLKVTVLPPDWTQTILICNNTASTIPLKDIQFTFNFSSNISSIWGNPWLAWQITSHSGTQYTLHGGQSWSPDLPSDPNCTKPISIQFSSSPTQPAPIGPFVFEIPGVTPPPPPSTVGSINVVAPNAPAVGLANPMVKVEGMGITKQQIVNWGQPWLISGLPTGSYILSVPRVDNGLNYYFANPVNITVQANLTAQANLIYQNVSVGNLTVSLLNSPLAQAQLTFSGKNYTLTKTVGSNTVVSLPSDQYTISVAPLTGYSVALSPNPITIPGNSSLTVTYIKSNMTAIFGGYFESWSSNTPTDLSNIPAYINYVYLAFMRPDSAYALGSLKFLTAGLEFPYANGSALKQAIATLHQTHPNTKILVSVGGADYTNWAQFNPQSVVNFVKDFGLDGVDIDFEPRNPNCSTTNGTVKCQTDAAFIGYIEALRSLLPRPYILTAAAWSTGAFGEGQWATATPKDTYTGMMLNVLRSPAGKDLDMLNVMSYDAGNTYNELQALAAYSYYFPNAPISMGVEVPPEAWGGHIYTIPKVNQLTLASMQTAQQRSTPPGMMMWSLQQSSGRISTASYPDAQMIATTICNNLGLENCNSPI